jgi:hypothetical protein
LNEYKGKSNMSESKDRPLSFFVAGEAYLVLEHDRSLRGELLLEQLRQHPFVRTDDRLYAAVQAVESTRVVTIDPPTEAAGCNGIMNLIFRLLRPTGGAESLFNPTQPPPKRVTSMVFTRVEEFTDPKTQPEFIESFIQPLYYRVREFQQDGEALSIQTIAPNWLMSSAQGQFGTGGPGAKPVPIADPQEYGSAVRPWEFQMPETFRKSMGTRRQSVEVAVLDTAPTANALKQAFANPDFSGNALLQRVKAQIGNGSNVMYAPQNDVWRRLNDAVQGVALDQHDYDMSDHGLFVAGIIASIAPEARIRIIEVLNKHGVGTVETITNGLNQLLKERRTVPLVINLSLTLQAPTLEHVREHLDSERMQAWMDFIRWMDENPRFFESSIAGMKEICHQLNQKGVILIAAAGNEGTAKNHPPARYPAAFDSVTGVGALDHNSYTAPYSNQADTANMQVKPPNMGFVTFGGDMNMSTGEADSTYGVLGLYIGQFPDLSYSTNGWARWAGTSFAAPVIAGTLAHQLSAGRSRQQAFQDIRDVQQQVDLALGPGEVFSMIQGG